MSTAAGSCQRRIQRFLLVLMLMLSGWLGPAVADDRVTAAAGLVDALVADIKQVVAKTPSAEMVTAETNRMIAQYFDFDRITRFSAGPYWKKATPAERDAYGTAFRKVLITLAEKQFDVFSTIEYTPASAFARGDSWVIVPGKVHDSTGKLPDAVIQWRVLTKAGKQPRIFDIEVENISMLLTQQEENTAVIRQNGGRFSALIEAMEKQAADIAAAN